MVNDRPEFKKGDPLRAEDLQALADEVFGSSPVRATGGIQARRGPKGLQFSFSAQTNSSLGKTTSAITARSGTTPGSGTVDFYWRAPSGDVANTGEGATVYNVGTAISSGKWVWAQKDAYDEWWVAPLECEP